jgi:polysaccharide biosynthesis/export protein
MERPIITDREERTGGLASVQGVLGAALALIATALVASGCASSRPYHWVEDVQDPPPTDDAEYQISRGDVLGVRVWNQESMSTARAKVRDDGKISVPFLQDVEVTGMKPAALASRLQVELKKYVVSPIVTVTLEDRAPVRVSVLGEVAKPGRYDLQVGAGVLHALAAAGGLTPYAPRDGIYVLRVDQRGTAKPSMSRIRFRYGALAGGAVPAATFHLRSDDVVVVE